MVAVHTLAVFPSVKALNEAVGRAFLARLRALIDEAGDPSWKDAPAARADRKGRA